MTILSVFQDVPEAQAADPQEAGGDHRPHGHHIHRWRRHSARPGIQLLWDMTLGYAGIN